MDEFEQGGESPCWAHLVDDLESRSDALILRRSNTVVYCQQWSEVVDFYRTTLGLAITMQREWFIEFELHPGSYLSVADAARATVAAGDGSGLTLSWLVDDAVAARGALTARGVEATAVSERWGAASFFVNDPAGNRIEFWSAI